LRIIPLIVFGVTLVVGGLYWTLWDGARDFLNNILIEDSYYTLIFFVWRMIPAIIIMIGIMCLIAAGISKARERVVEY